MKSSPQSIWLGMVVAFCLTLQVHAVEVSSVDDLAEALKNEQTEDIVLQNDIPITNDGTLNVGASKTIDVDGFTLTQYNVLGFGSDAEGTKLTITTTETENPGTFHFLHLATNTDETSYGLSTLELSGLTMDNGDASSVIDNTVQSTNFTLSLVNSTLTRKSLATSGAGSVTLAMGEGSTLNIIEDLSVGGSGELLLDATHAAGTGGAITVGGTLTLNQNLSVSDGTASLSALSAGKLQLAGAADADVTFEVADGKTVETTEITGANVAGSKATISVSEGSTLSVLEDTEGNGGNVTLGAEDGGDVAVSVTGNSTFTIVNDGVFYLREGNTITVDGSDATDPDNILRSSLSAGNLTLHGSETVSVLNGASLSVTGTLTTNATDSDPQTFYVDGTNASDSTVVSQIYAGALSLTGSNVFTLQNGGTLGIGSDTAINANVSFATDDNATSGGVVNASGYTIVLNRSLTLGTVSGATENTLTALYADSLELATDSDSSVTFTVQDGLAAQYGSVVGAQGTGSTLNITVKSGGVFGAYTSESDTTWTGNMTLGKADGTGGDWNLSVSDRGTMMVAGNFEAYMTDDSTFTVDGSRGDNLDYSVYISGNATLQALENGSTVSVTNGGLIHITGTLTSGGKMTYVLDGEGVSNYTDSAEEDGEDTEKTMPSAIVAGGLAFADDAATVEFQLLNGGTLDFTNDTSLGERVKVVLGGSGAVNGSSLLLAQDYEYDSEGNASLKEVNLTLENGLVLELADGATSGGRISVSNGTLTVNMESLTVASDSPINELSATKLQLAGAADADVTFEVTDGLTTAVGEITGAEMEGTSATIKVSEGSTFGAYTNEENTSWTGNVALGAAAGGDVNLTVTDGSSFLAAGTMTLQTQGGNKITVDGTRIGEDSDGNETTIASSITGNTVSIYANDGTSTTSTILDVTNGGQIYGTESVFLGANSGGYLRGTFTGKTNTDKTVTYGYLASGGTATIGGAGTSEVHFTDGGTLNASNIILGDTADGTVSVGVVGSSSSITTFQTETTDTDGNTTQTGGDIVIGKAGTANVSLTEGSQMIAAGSLTIGKSGTGTVEMEDSVLQSSGILIGANSGSVGELTISGSGSAVYVQANTLTSTTANGTGTLNVTDLKSADSDADWSGVYLNAGSGIYLNGAANFDNSVLYFGISSDDDGNVTRSTLSTGTGTTSFTNGSVIAGTPTFAGDVSIDKTSTFQMGISLSGGSEAMTLTNGSLTIEDGANLDLYLSDSGILTAMTWTVATIDSDSSDYQITGTWDISSPIPFYNFSQNISSDGHTQTITAVADTEYFEKRYPNANGNELAVMKFMETYPDSWYNTLMNIAYGTDEQVRNTVSQMTGSIRANSMMMARQSLWVPVQDRISWDEACEAYLGPQNPFCHTDEYSSLWFQLGYRGRNIDSNAGLPGYDVNSFQLSLGVDRVFETYLAAGVFFHFGNPVLEQQYASAEAWNYSVGAYFGYKMYGGFELKGMGAYTLSDYDLERDMNFFFGESYKATSGYKGDTLTLSLELARPFFFGSFVLRPLVAIDNENVWQNDALESGAGMYSMVYDRSSGSWTYARFGVHLDYALAQRFTLKGRFSYSYQLDGTEGSTLVARYRGTSHNMQFCGTYAGDDYVNVGLTGQFSFGTTHTTTLFGTYDAYLSSEMTSHYVNAGIQFAF
ncbi:MAG: autotransporter domain-containing protein [Planctomycetia bacterium]|nr:autotransporter domain-containing protein [Planctomycetia bacterium]